MSWSEETIEPARFDRDRDPIATHDQNRQRAVELVRQSRNLLVVAQYGEGFNIEIVLTGACSQAETIALLIIARDGIEDTLATLIGQMEAELEEEQP